MGLVFDTLVKDNKYDPEFAQAVQDFIDMNCYAVCLYKGYNIEQDIDSTERYFLHGKSHATKFKYPDGYTIKWGYFAREGECQHNYHKKIAIHGLHASRMHVPNKRNKEEKE